MNIKISVVIPVYNAEKSIEKCLSSLLNCDYPKELLEIIAVNNNSTDSSCQIISKFKVRLINELKQGRSLARNKGIREARGELIAFIDADVYVERNWLREMAALFNKDDIGAAACAIVPCLEIGSKSLNLYRYKSISNGTKGTFCLTNIKIPESPMINSAACMYRKNILTTVGCFDEDLVRHEDIDLSKRVSLQGYHIAVDFKIKANVIYHGDGWCDYLIRSFWNGYYKIDYKTKWRNYANGHYFTGEMDHYVSSHFQNAKQDFSLIESILNFIILALKAMGMVVRKLMFWNSLKAVEIKSSEKHGEIYFADSF